MTQRLEGKRMLSPALLAVLIGGAVLLIGVGIALEMQFTYFYDALTEFLNGY
jgi:hypothetical protein